VNPLVAAEQLNARMKTRSRTAPPQKNGFHWLSW